MINPLRVGRAVESLGGALVPYAAPPQARPSSAPQSVYALGLDALASVRTREEAEAFAWRAQRAESESRELGRIGAAFLVLGATAWLHYKGKRG